MKHRAYCTITQDSIKTIVITVTSHTIIKVKQKSAMYSLIAITNSGRLPDFDA